MNRITRFLFIRRRILLVSGAAWILVWLAVLSVLTVRLGVLHAQLETLNAPWTTYTPANSGLASGSVRDLVFDHENRLWIGTSKGLSILTPDGQWATYTTTNSGLVNNSVHALAIDEQGQMWVGTNIGLSMFAPDGTWTTYTTANSGLVDDSVGGLDVDQQGQVWVGTSKGVSVLDTQGHWSTHTFGDAASNEVQALTIDDRGRVLVGTMTLVSMQETDGQWTSVTLDGSGALAVDAQGRVWVGTNDELGAFDADGHRTTYSTANLGMGDGGKYIWTLAIDGAGRVWVGTLGGLARLDTDGNWTTYTTDNSGLAGDNVRALAFDDQGRVWAGTHAGLSRYDEGVGTSSQDKAAVLDQIVEAEWLMHTATSVLVAVTVSALIALVWAALGEPQTPMRAGHAISTIPQVAGTQTTAHHFQQSGEAIVKTQIPLAGWGFWIAWILASAFGWGLGWDHRLRCDFGLSFVCS